MLHDQSTDTDDNSLTSSSYDPHSVDAYAEHLTEVNQVKQVIASEDIRNAQGMLLIKKGQPISKDMVDRIVQFKLLRPLENTIDISDALTADKVQHAIHGLLADGQLRELYTNYELEMEIKRCCNMFFQYPILAQKLTVLSLQMPQQYQLALSVAWISLVLALRLRLSADERINLFIAALVHDIGMLHISRDIVTKTGNLTPEEWRAMQSHVIIGQKILQQVKGLPPSIPRAVLEHHEMCDGTGYPFGRFGKDLGLPGQIINILDSIIAIYTNKLMPKGGGTRCLLPILQINGFVYHTDVCNTLIQLLREHKHTETQFLNAADIDKFVAELTDSSSLLKAYHTKLIELTELLPTDSTQQTLRAASSMTEHLSILLRRSGVLSSDYIADLQTIASTAAAAAIKEIEDFYLMLQEVQWQLVKLTRILHTIADSETALPAPGRQALQHALSKLPTLSAR